jgi:hypothetical protein
MTEETGKGWEATRTAWDEVGNRFAELGRRLGDQYRKLGEERGPTEQEEVRSSVKEAVQVAVQQVDQAFTSVGNALRDPDSKQELQRAARSLADAVSATFSDLSSEIRELGSKPPPKPEAPSE